jgi:hypothetical protein
MKVIFIRDHCHPKNYNFANLSKKLKIFVLNTLEDFLNMSPENVARFDAVFSLCRQIDVSKYPTVRFVFGPHFFIFPEQHKVSLIKNQPNAVYNCLSNWNVDVHKSFSVASGVKFVALPFAVNTKKFCEIKPIHEKTDVILYVKRRKPEEFQLVENIMRKYKINYKLFSHSVSYTEEEYLKTLQNCKFMFSLDAHESQGFELQEAMSCNVPLCVWSVKSLNQEIGCNYIDFPASSVPFWDDKCGEIFYEAEDLENTLVKFLTFLPTYKPREFVLETVSVEACEDRIIEELKKIPVQPK